MNQTNYNKGILLSAVILAAMVGCQKAQVARKILTAPQSQQQTGISVKLASESELTQLLESFPEMSYREANKKHGLYELYNVSIEQIQNVIGNVPAEQNQFFTINTGTNKKAPVALFEHNDENEKSATPKNNGPKKCVNTENPPIAEIHASENINMRRTAELGASTFLSARQSTSQLLDGKINVFWAYRGPEYSKTRPALLSPDRLDIGIIPDVSGEYSFLLLVQDSKGGCAQTGFSFVVTENAPLLKTQNIPAAELDLDSFDLYHLSDTNSYLLRESPSDKGKVVVAVIDTGVHFNSPLLRDFIAINPNEIPDNGIDDDDNGLIDDTHGYDFINSDASPYDDDGHGSHVAGIIAGKIVGMAPGTKILPIKALSSIGGDALSIASAILYAVDSGAHVVNMSLGSPSFSFQIYSAVAYAESKGVLIIAAAGNGTPEGLASDNDVLPNYPSSFDNENIISVTSSSLNSLAVTYANYGQTSVDITAPGGDEEAPIISAAKANPLGELVIGLHGTSMATPVVAGAAALILAEAPTLQPHQVKDLLVKSATPHEELKALTVSGGTLDVAKAYKNLMAAPEKSLAAK